MPDTPDHSLTNANAHTNTATNSEGTGQAHFPIRVVSAETGVNAITLRAWERRYGLLTPKRTAKGHRLYTQQDIQLIKQVVSLLEQGIAISQALQLLQSGQSTTFDSNNPASQAFDTGTASAINTTGQSGELNHASGNNPSATPTSQWQQLRQQFQQAVSQFSSQQLAQVFEQTVRSFPLDLILRFLLIPIHQQLKAQALAANANSQSKSIKHAELHFYQAFLQAQLQHRLYQPQLKQQQARHSLIVFQQEGDQTRLLLASLLLKQLGIPLVQFSSGLDREHWPLLVQQLKQPQHQSQPHPQQQSQHQPAAVLTLAEDDSAESLAALGELQSESGLPVFLLTANRTDGDINALNQPLFDHGLTPLPDDLQQAALIIRDIINA